MACGETEYNNPFRYCGEYLDYESGLLYLRARYYDAGVGAFTQEDPAKDGLNWYVYCGGNPVNFWDPWGLDPNLGRAVNDYYAGKMTVTIAIRRPVANSRVVATVNGGKIDNGHTFLRLDDGNGHIRYIGFHPSESGLKEMVYAQDVDSKIRNDSDQKWNVAKTFEINADQYNAVLQYTNDVSNNGHKYNIETFNCTTFAIYALNKAGISFGQTNISRKQWTLPNNIEQQLNEYKLMGVLPAGIATDVVKSNMGDNVGYTPADAAQDLKYSRGVVFLNYYGMNDNYKGYVTIQN